MIVNWKQIRLCGILRWIGKAQRAVHIGASLANYGSLESGEVAILGSNPGDATDPILRAGLTQPSKPGVTGHARHTHTRTSYISNRHTTIFHGLLLFFFCVWIFWCFLFYLGPIQFHCLWAKLFCAPSYFRKNRHVSFNLQLNRNHTFLHRYALFTVSILVMPLLRK